MRFLETVNLFITGEMWTVEDAWQTGVRFGTFAAYGAHNDARLIPQRRAEIDRQTNGVAYSESIRKSSSQKVRSRLATRTASSLLCSPGQAFLVHNHDLCHFTSDQVPFITLITVALARFSQFGHLTHCQLPPLSTP